MAAMKPTSNVVLLALFCLALLTMEAVASSSPNCYQPPAKGGSKPPSKSGSKPPKSPKPHKKPPTPKPPTKPPITIPPAPKPPIKPPIVVPPAPKPPSTRPVPPKKPPPTIPPSPKPPTKPPYLIPPPAKPPTKPPKPPAPTPAPPAPAPIIPKPPFYPPPMIPPPATCPVDIIKFGVCVPVLGGILGNPLQSDCCALLGMIGVDVEVCLCAAINANVLGIINISKIDVIASILTTCGKKLPPKFACP